MARRSCATESNRKQWAEQNRKLIRTGS